MYPVSLASARLVYREFRRADLPLVVEYSAEPHGIFGEPGTLTTLDEAARWFAWMRKAAHAPERADFRLAVDLAETGELAGIARVTVDQPWRGIGSIGYALAERFWGRGYASEAAAAMCEFGFSALGLHRIEATINPENPRSIRVAEKLGMTREGLLREYFIERGGREDALLYSVLVHEWRSRTGPAAG